MAERTPWDEMLDELRTLLADGSRPIEGHRVALASDARCTECGRLVGDTGRWYSDGTGALVPYCKACAEIELPVN